MPDNYSEEELLELARKYSFRSRMDRSGVTGPIFVWGRGSVVRDANGKEYLDFNSGQMCAALGHNHPRIVQALHPRGHRPVGQKCKGKGSLSDLHIPSMTVSHSTPPNQTW